MNAPLVRPHRAAGVASSAVAGRATAARLDGRLLTYRKSTQKLGTVGTCPALRLPGMYKCPVCGSTEISEVTAFGDEVRMGLCPENHTAPLTRRDGKPVKRDHA